MNHEEFNMVIEAIFAKLAVRYGAVWLRQWDSVDMALVKADWTEELRGFANNLEPLRYALRHLPERCPNVAQFRTLANSCPLPEFKALPAPKADERVVAELLAKQTGLKKVLAPAADPKEWARRIMARSEAGDKIRPYTLLSALQALGMEGKMPWQ